MGSRSVLHPFEEMNGRVVREYIGCSMAGALAAELHAIERDEREAEAQYRQAVREELEELAGAVDELSARCDLLASAALVAARYRQHDRGE